MKAVSKKNARVRISGKARAKVTAQAKVKSDAYSKARPKPTKTDED